MAIFFEGFPNIGKVSGILDKRFRNYARFYGAPPGKIGLSFIYANVANLIMIYAKGH